MTTLLVALFAYLLGSVSFAILVSRLFAMPDPRTYGSGNPGATNVLRTGRRSAAALTLLGDGGKGWLAVWLAAVATGEPAATSVPVTVAGAAVLLGHVFPVFHRFQGGKGVATAAGVLLGFNAWLGLATLATWIIIAVFFRMSSAAALVAALFAPLYAGWLFGLRPVLFAVLFLSAVLVCRHRANLIRIFAGTEPRLGRSADPPPQAPASKPPTDSSADAR